MQQGQQFYDERNRNTDPREQSAEQYGYPRDNQQGYIRNPRNSENLQRPRQRNSLPLIALIVIVCLIVGAWVAGSVLFSTGNLPTNTIAVTGHENIKIENGDGFIHVHTGNTNSIVVSGTRYAVGLGSSLDALKVDYTQAGNSVTIQTEGEGGIFFASNRIDLDVTIPAASNLTINDGSGNISLASVNGDVQAQTGSGSIEASNIQGATILKTSSGSIVASNINGQTSIESGSGSLSVDNSRLQGDSALHTGSGDINFTGSLDVNGTYRLESGSGNVNLTLPADSALLFIVQTGSGITTDDFNSNYVGSSPQARVTIHTGSGNIGIHKQ
ncbi:DUF4097 domain-containing protein [Ktedonobacteria bacterium brp13]|nr:DUF4097 domain-containing protein [Ktedonobacteria bacterium brp13]